MRYGHPFKGHRQAKKAILWRETERFSPSLSVIFIFTIAAVSFGFGVSLYCTSHPSGLRPLVKLFIHDPFRLLADQKIFGSMPCPGVCTGLMVVNQPQDGSRYGQ
jgi:hypothetical protein